jgi:hypothetical protein
MRTTALAVLWLLVTTAGAGAQATEGSPDTHQHDTDGDRRGQHGPYPMNRDASGTAWQPDSSPMSGVHFTSGNWSLMTHGVFNAVYIDESGPRGDSGSFGIAMAGVAGRRSLARGALGFRLMVSGEPAMGPAGYPLLLQTGETADGVQPLIDRQHPHDFLMEAAVSWSRNVADTDAVFVYLGLAGAPPFGPPPFMHRASAEDNPVAPIGHHFLDSTHLSHGVATVGFVADRVKLEVGAFNGREPDHRRWGIQAPRLDSVGGRISVNPHRDWSLQWSVAHLNSPERLHQGLDVLAMTASTTFNRGWPAGNWQTTLAWGRNTRRNPPQQQLSTDALVALFASGAHVHVLPSGQRASPPVQSALLIESAATVARRHTMYMRFERAHKDELFQPDDARHVTRFSVGRASVGYIIDVRRASTYRVGVGVSGSITLVPAALRDAYGESPGGFMTFARIRL